MVKKIIFWTVWIQCRLFEMAIKYFPGWLLGLVDDIVFLKKKVSPIQPIPRNFCINREGFEKDNIDYDWWSAPKPMGISGVCRIKNGDDFLEATVESHLVLCDEIIIGDNNSTDHTKEIALRLAEKYPGRVRYFEYPYEVYPLGSQAFLTCPSNSIHSFAYQTNWTVAKAKYKYICKVDDDHLLIPEKGKEFRELVFQEKFERFVNFWGMNVITDHEGHVGVCETNPFAGKYGDCGLFPVSEYTYTYQYEGAEPMYHPYRYYRFGEAFIHLKYLKKNFGLTNISEEKRVAAIEAMKTSCVSFDYKKYGSILDERKVQDLFQKFHITNKAV